MVQFLFISCGVILAQENEFDGNAFLLNDHRCTIYIDSVGSKVCRIVKNDELKDKYYIFKFVRTHGDRIKVKVKYTIDAEHDAKQVLSGWIKSGDIGIYYAAKRSVMPFVYTGTDNTSSKIYIDSNRLANPFSISKVAFIRNQIWLQIVLEKRGEGVLHGWLSPTMQCVDIWNACLGN
ncbi:hypothetical protein GCM10023093_07920 [Nemorincola caseinilytica]|uniref:Uncharacterized protein n=1 Tax=Nemorincola caseinilytica TaxID=2054315 RepID=A0ABP8N697_9BACT